MLHLPEIELDKTQKTIVSLKNELPPNNRIIFLETFIAIKKIRLPRNIIIENINTRKEKEKYISENDLKINWGQHQLFFLANYLNK